MNILAVCHYGLYQDLDASFVHNLIREYAALGHRVRVIVPIGVGKAGRDGDKLGPAVDTFEKDGVEICDVRYLTISRFGEKGFNSARAIAAIRRHSKKLLGDFVPDVIHIQTLGFDSEIGVWLKSKYGCPLVCTTHGTDTVAPLERGDGEWLRQVCDRVDQIIADSDQLRERVKSCGTKTPAQTIHCGFIPRQPVPVDRDPWAVVQVGHLIPSKRVDTTIRAVARLRERYPQMTLTVIGQGVLREELQLLCSELGVADAVTFTGHIPNAEVFAAMCRSRYYVMASKPEGFGIVYLEAMAAGCIAVGTQGQGIADVIRHGENGFLVPADDVDAVVAVLEQCISQPEQAEAVARCGQQTALDFSWTHIAQEHLALFERMIAGE